MSVTAFWRGLGEIVFYYIFNVSILSAVQTETEIIFPTLHKGNIYASGVFNSG